MKFIQAVLVGTLLLLSNPQLAANEPVYVLSASPLEIVSSETKFRPFAEAVRSDVERLLGIPAMVDDPIVFKTLLSTRVHLAHHFADNENAVATAAWIRSLQADPVEKSFAGLTTFAAVEARRQHPGVKPADSVYRAAFAREFAQQLGQLPHTAAIGAMLRRQHEKIASLSEADLLAETREKIAPAIRRRGYCSLHEADQLVRVRHRIVSILPVKTEILQTLEAAIAARPSP